MNSTQHQQTPDDTGERTAYPEHTYAPPLHLRDRRRFTSTRYTIDDVRDVTVAECYCDELALIFAAAPETAAERDWLRMVNARLLNALKTIVQRAIDYPQNEMANLNAETACAAIAAAEWRQP